MKPYVMPLTKFRNPKEFQCMGFNFTDVDMIIKKGHIQFNTDFIEMDGRNMEFCGQFERAMKAGPISHMDEIKEKFTSF